METTTKTKPFLTSGPPEQDPDAHAKPEAIEAQLRYDHRSVEQRWQKAWLETTLDVTDISGAKKPFYNLMMFPYPSAEGLHVGNMYAFTGSDIYGRFKRMQGYDVFEPIGLDGFGIHSENYAFKAGRHPMDQAVVSEQRFYKQLHRIGAMYDWSRSVETYRPDYYRWTQWLFVQMFKHGLAYRGKAAVNWCPSCKTVLADEQVIDGTCERCGYNVSNRLIIQWFLKITAYAEKLLENIPNLDWSEKVKVAQNNWIGKKDGIEITYSVVDEKGQHVGDVACFTTRPDTNFGATFVAIAPEHPFVNVLLGSEKVEPFKFKGFDLKNIQSYVDQAKARSKDDRAAQGRKKTGVFTGLYCVNQLNNYKMPLYVSDFVLMEFGTGAVIGVPGHDKRDFEFAQAMNLPVMRVVVASFSSRFGGDTSPITSLDQVQEEEGTMVNSDFLNGMDVHQAIQRMIDYLEEKGWGKRVTTYHLRDWLISRQRYWGPPIPMIYCRTCASGGKSWFTSDDAKHMRPNDKFQMTNDQSIGHWTLDIGHSAASNAAAGWYPVPEDQLPVLLPRIDDYKPGDDGVAPLAKHKEFYETSCPGCRGKAVRETDVSDTFLDSSWYFLRYPSVSLSTPEVEELPPRAARDTSGVREPVPWDPSVTKKWLPVTMYTGGAEHSVLHLMYSRFITMALHDMDYIDFDEPFTKFFAHGLVIKEGAKMSKSKENIINPDVYLEKYGIDALRLYLMFMGPYSQGGDFRDSAMEGMHRWVQKVWRFAMRSIEAFHPRGGGIAACCGKGHLGGGTQQLRTTIKKALHRAIKRVGEDIDRRRYNTAIAAMMEFVNAVIDGGGVMEIDDLGDFLKILAPFAPFMTEELYQRLRAGNPKSQFPNPRPPRYAKRCGQAKQIQNPISKSLEIGNWKLDIPFDSIHLQPWPAYDDSALKEEEVSVIVQVNGRHRDTLQMSNVKCQMSSEVEQAARASEKVKKYLVDQSVKKVIFIPGRLINFVL